MKIRTDVAEMLRAGHSDTEVARGLHVDRKAVAKARAALSIPKHPRGPEPAATVEDLFQQRVAPTEGGHMEWTGYVAHTTPALRHQGRLTSAYRVAFRIANGREPEGYALPSCGRDGCVMPGHHADRADRKRAEAKAAVTRAWVRGRKRAARALERERAKAEAAREQRLDALYADIFGDSA